MTNTNEKSFLVGNEVAALDGRLSEMTPNPEKNWLIIQEQYAFFEEKYHILLSCAQLLFAKQLPNLSFDAVCSLFSKVHASVKNYQSALFKFHMNI